MMAFITRPTLLSIYNKGGFGALRRYLSQKDNPLAVGPNDMIYLRAHSLPGQLRSSKARLPEMRADPQHNASQGRFYLNYWKTDY